VTCWQYGRLVLSGCFRKPASAGGTETPGRVRYGGTAAGAEGMHHDLTVQGQRMI